MTFQRRVKTGIIRGGGTASVITRRDYYGSRSTPTTAPLDAETPMLRTSARSSLEITLTRSTREWIHDDLFWLTRSDGQEAGGFLFGRPFSSWHRLIEITMATSTANAERARDSLLLDSSRWAAAERAIELEGRNEVMLGSWHCHPGTRDRRPSDADLRVWLRMRDYFDGRRFSSEAHVGLIYSSSYDAHYGDSDWVRPEVSAWVVSRDRLGNPICEPATIKGRF